MNNIIKFERTETIQVTDAAFAIARAVIVNDIGPDELFAAIEAICNEEEL